VKVLLYPALPGRGLFGAAELRTAAAAVHSNYRQHGSAETAGLQHDTEIACILWQSKGTLLLSQQPDLHLF
jgi:hypothetical protein